LISVVLFHFLAGLVAGSVFTVRMLLMLVALVLIECAATIVAWGSSAVGWSVASLIAVQIGYLGGIYFRSLLEHAGIAVTGVQPRHRS
jgi:hypothetical protein